ncbi:MAG: homoserine kinase [Atopobiaceae bacterium]|jgi:homoserine kinase|nr:homoserine kinase [Atopobiaceae bacterium]MCH4119586.1 homoserine kinase [Atopobiaceae bacterium]MCI1389621.1 homoserine kinase [Atopobiaceae bacterium]MCI1431593.1 homoserine kinase [Atopobiaceae bacterium]MCI1470029.1 homoserine kinase [Atopobiaceae bacterium]
MGPSWDGEGLCHVSVPATSANIGVGFDCLGMALDLRAEFGFQPADELAVEGCPERFQGPDNLVWQSYLYAARRLGHEPCPLRIRIDSPIPLSGGLGSSSACVVAGISAAQIVHGQAIDPYTTIKVAVALEGHPDNVAPAILGGVVSSFSKDGDTTCVRRSVAPGLRFVAIAPPTEVRTEDARRAMPTEVPLEVAVWQMGRCVAMVDALRSGDLQLLAKACDDRLHEPYRRKLIPCYDDARACAMAAGAAAFFISGSGSTMIAVCGSDATAGRVAESERSRLDNAWVRVLRASDSGVRAFVS